MLDEVLYGEHRCIFLPGSRYGGKTFVEILAQILHGKKYVKPRMLLAGTSFDDIRANTLEALEYWTDNLEFRFRWPRGATEFFIDDQTWEVRGLRHDEGARRVKGRGYKGAVIDELSEIYAGNWHMMYTSVRGPGVKIIASWNPKSPRHFTEIMAKNPAPFNGVVIHSTMKDNRFADEASVAAFQNKDAFPDYQYQRLVMGLPSAPEGQVYPIWYETEIEYNPDLPCFIGADYGESSITAAHYFQPIGKDKWAVVKEYYHANPPKGGTGHRDVNEQARKIKEAAPGGITKAYVDPSAKGLRNALRRAGVAAVTAYNKKPGYDITNTHLQSGDVLININACPALVSEIEDLVYNKSMGAPDPNCVDHATDDLRYAVCGVSPLRKATFRGGN